MSEKRFRRYARDVVAQIQCDAVTGRRITDDIIEMLEEKSAIERMDNPVGLLGPAAELADEFRENLGLEKIAALPSGFREYKSGVYILGLPLYHVILGNGFTKKGAKGIFAFGPAAVGIVAAGAASVGVISLGALSVGVFSLGGMAVGLLAAVGGLAVGGDIAVGGMAVANSLAIGGYAVAKDIAIGGVTSAKLMAYNQSYQIPPMLDESTAIAFRMTYMKDFVNKATELFPDFGPVKKMIIEAVRWGQGI